MGKQFFVSGNITGFQYENINNPDLGKNPGNGIDKRKEDADLIIEENTVYEIDRECYERLKRQRKRKTQDKRNV